MAYGRLDVFWPDGLFQTFPLINPNTSIGRSTGNTVTLDTNTISRYHFSVTHENGAVFVTDLESANGTFVDGVRLEDNEPRTLYGGEEIQIGHLRIIYHQIDEQPTRPISPVDEDTQQVEASLPDFHMSVTGPDQSVAPGAHISSQLLIQNTSDTETRFIVDVLGLPEGWLRMDRPSPMIDAGDNAEVQLNFKPVRRSDSRPGDYAVTVCVHPEDHPDEMLQCDVTLNVLPYSGFGMAVQKPVIVGSERFRLHLHNQGSKNLPLRVSGKDRHGKVSFEFVSPRVTLAPGTRQVVNGEIKPRRPTLFGSTHTHPVEFIVKSEDAAGFIAALPAKFVETPPLPGWALGAVSAAVGVMALVLVVGLAFLLWPRPEPVISAFSVSPDQVARGEPLRLEWAVLDAAELAVTVDGRTLFDAIDPSSTTGVDLPTDELTGEITLSLLARNGRERAQADRTVQVYQPMVLRLFTAEPEQLVRYVVQPLTLRWQVPGAETTRLSGLQQFTNADIEASYGEEGIISDIVGIPEDPFTLSLMAEDAFGNTLQDSLTINVVNPECVPANGALELRLGPNDSHQVVGTVPINAIVVVDAQVEGANWLRARLPGAVSGWARASEFTCASTFAVADLRIVVDIPPTPTPRPTGQPPPTPTVTDDESET